jgi:hypothetical protein
MSAYCEPADLYSYGLPRGAVPNPGRNVASVNASANALTLDEHGFATDDPVTFRAQSGGSLPAPLVEGTTYYAIVVDDARFSVAASEGGAAIDLTSAGSRVLVISRLPREAAIRWASAIIDQSLPAHAVPLTAPYPEIVVATCAELAAGKLAGYSGAGAKSLADMIAAANARIAKWAKGVPLRGENTSHQTPTNQAAVAVVPFTDSRGWNRYGGIE